MQSMWIFTCECVCAQFLYRMYIYGMKTTLDAGVTHNFIRLFNLKENKRESLDARVGSGRHV